VDFSGVAARKLPIANEKIGGCSAFSLCVALMTRSRRKIPVGILGAVGIARESPRAQRSLGLQG
jgi:hypothetical protein